MFIRKITERMLHYLLVTVERRSPAAFVATGSHGLRHVCCQRLALDKKYAALLGRVPAQFDRRRAVETTANHPSLAVACLREGRFPALKVMPSSEMTTVGTVPTDTNRSPTGVELGIQEAAGHGRLLRVFTSPPPGKNPKIPANGSLRPVGAVHGWRLSGCPIQPQ